MIRVKARAASVLAFMFVVLLLCFADSDRFWKRDIWIDERVTIKLATMTPILSIPAAKLPSKQPPLYEMLIHLFADSANVKENIQTARVVSFAFSIFALAYIVFFLRELDLCGRVFFSIAYILNNYTFYSATEGRFYAMGAFFLLLSVVFFIRAVTSKKGNIDNAFAYGLVTLVMLYTTTVSMPVFICQFLFSGLLLLRPGRPKQIRASFEEHKPLVMALLLIAFSYWFFAVAITHSEVAITSSESGNFGARVSVQAYLKTLWHNVEYVLIQQIMMLHNFVLPFLLIPIFLVGLAVGLRKNPRAILFLCAVILIEFIVLTYATLDRRAVGRYFPGSFVAFSMIATFGYVWLVGLVKAHRKVITAVFASALFLYYGVQFARVAGSPYPNLYLSTIERLADKNEKYAYLTPTGHHSIGGKFTLYRIDKFSDGQFRSLFSEVREAGQGVVIVSRTHMPSDRKPRRAVELADEMLPHHKKSRHFFESLDIRLSRYVPWPGFVYFYEVE